MIITPRRKRVDPYQDNVTALFHFNNSLTTYTTSIGSVHTNSGCFSEGGIPFGEGNSWNATGTAAYQSKGTYASFSTNAKFGTHSYNANGANRLHFSNYMTFSWAKDFTLEFFVYPTSVASDQYPFGRGDVGSTTIGSFIKMKAGGNGLEIWWNNTSIISTTTAGLFSPNNWYHIALTRQGNSWRAFVNGIQEGLTATNTSKDTREVQPTLGGDNTTNTFFSGQIDEFRFTRGVARYTANFSPPTEAFPDYVPTYQTDPSTDPHRANVVLMLHLNGAEGSTTLTDSSPTPKAVTVVNGFIVSRTQLSQIPGQRQVQRFGSGSFRCFSGVHGYPGTAGHFQLPSHTDFDFGTGDFTIEFQATRCGGHNGNSYIFSGGSTSLELYFNSTAGTIGNLHLSYNGTVLLSNIPAHMTDGYWRSICVSRISGTIYLHVDGVLMGSVAFTNSLNVSNMLFGRRTTSDTTTHYSGQIDELRITKGVGRYVGNYIPQRSEFPDA